MKKSKLTIVLTAVLCLNTLNFLHAENFLKNLGFNLVRVRCFDSHYEIQTSVNDIGKLNSQEVWQKIKNYFQSKDINKVYPSSTGYKFGCMQEDM